MTAIYLASSSPRRKMLLEQIGVPHTVLIKNVAETGYEDLPPDRQVEKLALRKAAAVAGDLEIGRAHV